MIKSMASATISLDICCASVYNECIVTKGEGSLALIIRS